MNQPHNYRKDFEVRWFSEHSDDECLPAYHGGPNDLKDYPCTSKIFKDKGAATQEQTENKNSEEPRNPFWISVSDYELDRAYIVYRFFHDIGNIVAKNFTKTNRMYLKYFSLVDSQIALSYNGQKIGYGGDIRVKVKVENPVTENALIEALENSSADNDRPTGSQKTSTMTITINVEDARATNEVIYHQLDMETSKKEGEEPGVTHKKVRLVQWFREKLSYVFYFY
ncbi:uncharacterized protein LOC108033516 [Drosophila biarmipes]|uniref:uncharacterized protein LOC108033516 n=1 Tax=Drosophila biarmipes TaxID=125945 RepID=UPI0007E8B306|nr:uncharacterized protein LOC108033516 [Drosophila biarmipes]